VYTITMFTKYARIIMTLTVMITGLLAPMRIELVVGQAYAQPEIRIVENTASAIFGFSTTIQNGELNCGHVDVLCGIAKFFAVIFTFVSGLLAALSGLIMDYFLAYSINSTTYQDTTGFITDSWTIVRDFTNIAFVFAFLFIGIALILDIDIKGSNPRKLFANVILIALLMNFSLFFTRFVIDAGNILANVFYSNMTVNQSTGGGNTIIGTIVSTANSAAGGGVMVRGVGVALSSRINTQSILGQAGGTTDSPIVMYVFISFIVGVLNFGMVYIFIFVTFLFLLRIVMLWIYMIVSPIAFISTIIPGGTNWSYIGFKNWSEGLINQSFLAPVFLFFMYIILRFLERPLLTLSSQGTTLIPTMINAIFPFLLLFGLLWFSRSIALSMSGELGKKISGIATMVAGGAVAAGLGATAMAYRKTAGRAGSAIANSETLKKFALGDTSKIDTWVAAQKAKGGIYGRVAGGVEKVTTSGAFKSTLTRTSDIVNKKANDIAGSSFDIRNIQSFGIGDTLRKNTGGTLQENIGFREIQERNEQEKEKRVAERKKRLMLGENSQQYQDLASAQADEAESQSNLNALEDDFNTSPEGRQIADKKEEIAEKEKEVAQAKIANDTAKIARSQAELQGLMNDLATLKADPATAPKLTAINNEKNNLKVIRQKVQDAQNKINRENNERIKLFVEQVRNGSDGTNNIMGPLGEGALNGIVGGLLVGDFFTAGGGLGAALIGGGGIAGGIAGLFERTNSQDINRLIRDLYRSQRPTN
jgi:hypothetical protein